MTISSATLPSLEIAHLFDVHIDFAPMQILRTPVATRLIAVVATGTFTGPRASGAVLPGGGDWLVLGTDNVARLDIRATFQTDDGAYLFLTNTGRVTLHDDARDRWLAGETLTSEHIDAWTAPLFETGDERYAWINSTVNVGLVELSIHHIDYRMYTLL